MGSLHSNEKFHISKRYSPASKQTLINAIRSNNESEFSTQLDRIASEASNVELINFGYKQSCLHLIAILNSSSLISILQERLSDSLKFDYLINLKNDYGYTPVALAIINDSFETFTLLLKTNKAHLNLKIKKLCSEAPSKKYSDALQAYVSERAHELKDHQMKRVKKNNHYCGRKDVYFCNTQCSSESQCGPKDGCNCADCGIFDLIEGIKPWKHRTYIDFNSGFFENSINIIKISSKF